MFFSISLFLRVQTNGIRMASKDKDYHFFASDFTLDRINLEGINETAPNIENIKVTAQNFIPNGDEYKHFKKTLKLARQLLQFQGFSWMKSIVPEHIPHDYEADMAKKSEVYILPVSRITKQHTKIVYISWMHMNSTSINGIQRLVEVIIGNSSE